MAGAPFPNDAVGGTILLFPAIQSPNFSVTDQTGWAIYQDGSAVFFSLDIVGGSITGPNYSIDNTGFTLYNGIGQVVGQFLWQTGLQMYAPPPGGNLVLSLSPANTTDQFGNVIPIGLLIGDNAQTQVLLTLGVSDQGILQWQFNDASVLNGYTEGQLFPSGGSIHFGQIYTQGPQSASATPGYNDFVYELLSSNSGGTGPSTSGAVWAIGYSPPTGYGSGVSNYITVGAAGTTVIAGSIDGVHPGTGTSTENPAVAETWQALTLIGSWTRTTNFHAKYRMLPTGDVQLSGRIQTTGTSAAIGALPSGYYQGSSTFLTCPLAVVSDGGTSAGQTARISLDMSGNLTLSGFTIASGTTISLDGVIFPVSAG